MQVNYYRPATDKAPEEDRTARVTHGLDGKAHIEFCDDADPGLLEMHERRIAQAWGNAQRPATPASYTPVASGTSGIPRSGGVGVQTGISAAPSGRELHDRVLRPEARGQAPHAGMHLPARIEDDTPLSISQRELVQNYRRMAGQQS